MGAPTGWISGEGSRLLRHAKGERKIRSSRSCADWEEMTADMLRVIAGLNDRDDTAINGRFKGENGEVLEQKRQAERDAWSTVEHRLGDRDRELREQQK